MSQQYSNSYLARLAKISLMVMLFILVSTYAAYAEETLIVGNGKGVFCGTDGEDYLYACIKQDNDKRWLMVMLSTENEVEALMQIPDNTPVEFEFKVVKTMIPEGDVEMTVIGLTKITRK